MVSASLGVVKTMSNIQNGYCVSSDSLQISISQTNKQTNKNKQHKTHQQQQQQQQQQPKNTLLVFFQA